MMNPKYIRSVGAAFLALGLLSGCGGNPVAPALPPGPVTPLNGLGACGALGVGAVWNQVITGNLRQIYYGQLGNQVGTIGMSVYYQTQVPTLQGSLSNVLASAKLQLDLTGNGTLTELCASSQGSTGYVSPGVVQTVQLGPNYSVSKLRVQMQGTMPAGWNPSFNIGYPQYGPATQTATVTIGSYNNPALVDQGLLTGNVQISISGYTSATLYSTF